MSGLFDRLFALEGGSLPFVFGLLFDTALKGLVLIAVAAIAVYVLRKKSAAARHAAWTAAVIGHLALPVLTLLVPQWRIPLFPAPPWLETTAVIVPPTFTAPATSRGDVAAKTDAIVQSPDQAAGPTAATSSSSGAPTAAEQSASVRPLSTTTILGLLWILGTALVLLRLAFGTWKVGRLAKHGDRVDDGEWLSLTQRLANRLGITRPLTLLRGDRLAVPVTWGVVYPAVLLPPESNEWPEARRRFVLVHEMAHVKRFDALTQLLAQITVAVLWFDPFLWYAAHRMRVEREHACDDYVLRDGTMPSLYAGELLEMVQSIGSSRHENAAPAFAALAMARRSEFEGRMLAILDARQDRHTLGRRSAIAAGVALGLLVIPLAALRPFQIEEATAAVVKAAIAPAPAAKSSTSSGTYVPLSTIACDSVMMIPVDPEKNSRRWTHLHVLEDSKSDKLNILEFLSYSPARCAQAIVKGPAVFANDQLVSLPPGSTAFFREIDGETNRTLRIQPASGGRLVYTAAVNNRPVPYDESAEAWLAGIVPEALTETAVQVPERVARWVRRGGVERALAEIARITSTSSKRSHYVAVIESNSLTGEQRTAFRRHAIRNLTGSASDLETVLTKLSSARPVSPLAEAKTSVAALRNELDDTGSSGDSARLLTQAASTDDPAMILMALQGAKEISSDTDRRTLLLTVASRALGRKDATLRKAFFDAAGVTESDTDLRAIFSTALAYAQSDPEITYAVFKGVAEMSSDTDKRAVLLLAVEKKLLRTPALREAFMVSARTIESSTDFTVLMQAALKQ
jgi:beta-lactamase regulating signal transducer with metallopeptidase domain